MLKAVLFDLDGTLLPMNDVDFTNGYFSLLAKKLLSFGYDENVAKVIWQGAKKMFFNDGTKTNEDCLLGGVFKHLWERLQGGRAHI